MLHKKTWKSRAISLHSSSFASEPRERLHTACECVCVEESMCLHIEWVSLGLKSAALRMCVCVCCCDCCYSRTKFIDTAQNVLRRCTGHTVSVFVYRSSLLACWIGLLASSSVRSFVRSLTGSTSFELCFVFTSICAFSCRNFFFVVFYLLLLLTHFISDCQQHIRSSVHTWAFYVLRAHTHTYVRTYFQYLNWNRCKPQISVEQENWKKSKEKTSEVKEKRLWQQAKTNSTHITKQQQNTPNWIDREWERHTYWQA